MCRLPFRHQELPDRNEKIQIITPEASSKNVARNDDRICEQVDGQKFRVDHFFSQRRREIGLRNFFLAFTVRNTIKTEFLVVNLL
jgi:hypothetical protein